MSEKLKLNLIRGKDPKPQAVVEGEKSVNELDSLRKENKELKESALDYSTAFHDLKNFLTSTFGFVDLSLEQLNELIEKGNNINIGDIKTIRDYIATSLLNREKSLKLATDMMYISRTEIGNIEKIKFLGKEQISSIINILQDKLKQKNIDFKNEVPEDLEINFFIDLFRRTIENIVENAIKFTPENGLISISSSETDKEIKIYVKDNGIGMSKERINKLFKNNIESYKGTNGESGTGLGLYLYYKKLKSVSANLEAESEREGKGSTFIVTIPKEAKNE